MADLIVATMLPADGCCGVQTHIQAIAAVAREAGLSVHVATPYAASAWSRRATNVIGRALRSTSIEAGTRWSRAALAGHLRRQLGVALESSPTATVYAQDPLSAEAALELRGEFPFRLAAAVHYNLSEAEECAANGLTKPNGPLWNSLLAREARVLPRVDKLVFVSEFMRRVVTCRVPRLDRVDVEVIPNLPNLSAPDTSSSSTPEDLISIGTLEPRKNQAFLLQVLARAKALGRHYGLTLVGDGPSRPSLERQVKALGLEGQVAFRGYVPGAARLISEHRVYVHAAKMENLPIVFLEAMQRATPLFAPAVGGIPEIFDDAVEGRFWPLDDVHRASELLIDVLDSPPRHAAMAAAARRRYLRCFAPDVLAPRWLTAICGSSRGCGR